MKKLIAIATIGLAAAIMPAQTASARQVPVGEPFQDHGQWCQVYLNDNTGVYHTKCGPSQAP